jgi:hypothetical protein
MERLDITAEEDAAPLPFILRVPYEFGGFVTYWALRAMRMVPGIWLYHDPAGYETVVQRIVEELPGQTNLSLCLFIEESKLTSG